MKWCASCVLPDTRPGVIISENGVCNACLNSQIKTEIDWVAREEIFKLLCEDVRARSSSFDCVIPVSGGKDSTWQIVKCLEAGLRPLAVTWKTPARTLIGQKNLDNLVSLGVDHIDWQVNPLVEKKFMLKAFKRFGSTAIPMHLALFNIPLMVAFKFQIPLIIWGENSAFEYGSDDSNLMGHELTPAWFKKHGVTHGTTAEDWSDDDLSRKDLSSYFGPGTKEQNIAPVRAIFLGYYFEWDARNSFDIALKHGFSAHTAVRTGIYNFADIDDDFISIHHWLKWYKFGITRTFDNLSLEIRRGRMSRKDALIKLREVGSEEPHGDIEKFCKFTGISKAEFYETAETFRNKSIWFKDSGQWSIPDFLISEWNWDK